MQYSNTTEHSNIQNLRETKSVPSIISPRQFPLQQFPRTLPPPRELSQKFLAIIVNFYWHALWKDNLLLLIRTTVTCLFSISISILFFYLFML